MNNIAVTFFKNCRDNNAGTSMSLTWEDFHNEYLSDHLIVEDKDIYMFSGISFVNKREESFIRRCADNAAWITMAIFDFDGKTTITEAKERFKDIEYAGYTSFSHNTEAKGYKDCFRIVCPLSQVYPVSGFNERRKALKIWSGEVDESSTDRSRGFYLPSCTAERESEALCWYNEGKRLHMPDFAPEVIEINNIAEPTTIDDDKLKATIKEKLMTVHLGYEPDWIKTMWAMKGSGFTEQDFIDVTVHGALMDKKTVRDCQYRWNKTSGNVGNAGFLVNLIRRKVDPSFLKKKNNTNIDKLMDEAKNINRKLK